MLKIVHCEIKLTVKPNVAHGVKAYRQSSVRWKDILDVHCTDRVTVAAYRCIEEDNFTVNCKRCLISPSLFEASAVGGPSLHRLQLQCSCSLCTSLWSLCWRRCLRCAQGHLTTVFCKISVRRSKNCLEFSITRGRLTISRWPFHSCTIFEFYLSLIFRIPIPRFTTLRAVVSPGRTLRFDTVPQPDLLSSLSRIPFSATILYLMSRFWGIHLLSRILC